MNFNPFKKRSIAAKHVRTIDNKNILSQIKEFLFFGGSTGASTRSFVDSYENNPIVYMVVNKIATTSAAIKRIVEDSNGKEIVNSQIMELLQNPNTYQGFDDLYEKINEQLKLSGNVFIQHIEGIGAGDELHVFESADTKVLLDKLGGLAGYENTDNVGIRTEYNIEEILHIKMSSSSKKGKDWKYWGVSPLSALWKVVDASNELFTARGSIWKNRGIIGFLTNRSEMPMLDTEKENIQNTFDKKVGGADKTNKIDVTTANVDFVQVGMSPGDLKLLEGNLDNLRMISAGYKMNSVLFNDTAGSTFNNVLEAKTEAYTDVYIPLANKVDSRISKWLSIRLKVNEIVKIDVTTIEVLKASNNPVVNKLNNLPLPVAARIIEVMTHDQVLELVGLESTVDGNLLLGKSNSLGNGKEETANS